MFFFMIAILVILASVAVYLITKRGVTAWANANKISFSVAAADREKYGYLRVRAYARDDSGEIIFSQPMMLT